jgi:hypothetical protein
MRIAVPLLAVIALLAAGCNRSQTISTSEGEVTVTDKGKDSGTFTFTGKDGQKMTMDVGGGKLPADYPQDVPVYKGAKIVVTQTLSEKNGRNLVLESGDSVEAIGEFYRKELPAQGWTVENTMAVGGMNKISATKNKRQVTVNITDGNGKRTVMQFVGDGE